MSLKIIPAHAGYTAEAPERPALPVVAWAVTPSGNVIPITVAGVYQGADVVIHLPTGGRSLRGGVLVDAFGL